MNAARVHAEPVGTDTVDHGSVRRALELARLAPSLHNSQPWWWHVGDGVVHLHAEIRVGEPSQPVLPPTPRRALDDQIEYLPPGR